MDCFSSSTITDNFCHLDDFFFFFLAKFFIELKTSFTMLLKNKH